MNIHQDRMKKVHSPVATQADADQLVKELGIADHYSIPSGTSGQATLGMHFDDKTYWLKSI